MVTHSSVLARKVPRTEEHGGLKSLVAKGLDTTEHACRHSMWQEPRQ